MYAPHVVPGFIQCDAEVKVYIFFGSGSQDKCLSAFFTRFRGIVEETPSTAEHGRPSVMLEKYASATKMQPQSSGSLRSNAGIEKGKEIAARLNIHRIHSQLRGLDSTGVWK